MYSTLIAYLLWAIGGFGVLGLQRFYLRKIPTGFIWLFTGGLGFVGALYDFFTLADQVRIANLRAGYQDAIYGKGRQTIIIRDGYGPAAPDKSRTKDSMEKVILRTARKNGGLVSPGEIAIESDYSTDDARAALEKMAGKGMCEMRVRPSGVIVFSFPELPLATPVSNQDSEWNLPTDEFITDVLSMLFVCFTRKVMTRMYGEFIAEVY